MTEKKSRAQLIAGAVIILAALGYAGWSYHQSPDQVAGRELKRAVQAQAAGQVVQAAELYSSVAQSRASRSDEGVVGLRGLLEAKVLQALNAADAARVLAQVQAVRAAGQSVLPPKQWVELGWGLVATHSPKDAAGAKAVLDVISPLETDKAKLAAAAEPLLERIVAADPRNTAAAIEYAVLLERRRDCSRCEALLAPHAAALGRSEGARILGQIYAGQGKLDESYALLQPYTEEKLKVFVKHETEYREAGDAIEKLAIEKLRAGTAPADFYKRYDAADEATKREMVSAFINEQLSASSKLKSLTQTLRESATIVPVALDLGIVTVQRAQKLTDTAARNAQFQAAEKVFLSIRGLAGDNDGYRLYLGQVYYWLGKQAEGKKLFDELLEAHKRGYTPLLEVGGVLRSVGSVQEARALVEEAYGKAKDNEQRWAAAHFRSLMYTETDDELLWLERSDKSQGRIRASIHSTRATLADRKGQRATAKREYELAVAEFTKLPETATQLNSLALVHLALYGMEGNPQHRDLGLQKLDQALALLPSDSILLLNNIAAVRSAAAAALVGDRIDLALLRIPGELQLIDYLHNDVAGRDRVRQAVRDNAAVKKALAYSEKAALLAPRNPHSYGFAVSIASLVEDAPTMKALAAQAQAAKLDLGDIEQATQKVAGGTETKRHLEEMAVGNRQLLATLQQPAVQKLPISWAVAVGQWVEAQIVQIRWGQPVDADGLVKLSRKAYAQHPSSATYSTLVDALEARAALRLMKASPAFASDVAKHGRLIDLSTLLGIHINEDPELRRITVADADLVEVMSLVRERDRRYPGRASTWAWVLFRDADATYTQTLVTRLRNDPGYAAYLQLKTAFEPRQASTVISRYHHALAIGDHAGAKQVLAEARKAGIVLPDVLGQQLKV